MSQIEKLLQKFNHTPQTVRYADIEKVLMYVGFERITAKGSHVKWKHTELRFDLIIPVHDGECKRFYKQQVHKQIQHLIKKYL